MVLNFGRVSNISIKEQTFCFFFQALDHILGLRKHLFKLKRVSTDILSGDNDVNEKKEIVMVCFVLYVLT